jgi:hypothetical protein
MPIRRESFCESPQPGMMPTRACVSAKRASVDAISRSHASASSKPPVTATPFTAPMMGRSQRDIVSIRSPGRDRFADVGGLARLAAELLQVEARENARPAPVRMTTPRRDRAGGRNAPAMARRGARARARSSRTGG